MGYNLMIGEFKVDSDPEYRWARATAEVHSVEGHGNSVWNPSYSGWHNAMRSLGLIDPFFGDDDDRHALWTAPGGEEFDPLLRFHPGAVALTESHARVFEAARDAWKERGTDFWEVSDYRNGQPVWKCKPCTPEVRATLLEVAEWLAFWSRWALDNCKHPTFANS